MKKILLLGTLALAGCTSFGPPMDAPMTFLDPVEAEKTTIVKSDGTTEEVYWANLSEDQRRGYYSVGRTDVAITRRQKDGTLQFLPGAASISKGSYEIQQLYHLSRSVPCDPKDPSLGNKRVGIAMRLKARINSSRKDIGLSGSLLGLAAAASDDKVSGSLTLETIGIGAQSGTLQNYLGAGMELDFESITRAMEAFAVMRAVLEDETVQTTPHTLLLVESWPGACSGVANPAAAP